MARRRPDDLAGLRQRDPRVFGARPVKKKRPAEHLRDLATGAPGELRRGTVALDVGVLAEADLDELVVEERAVDRGDEAVVDAALADLDDGLELVAESAQVASLLAGQNPGTLSHLGCRRRRPTRPTSANPVAMPPPPPAEQPPARSSRPSSWVGAT